MPDCQNRKIKYMLFSYSWVEIKIRQFWVKIPARHSRTIAWGIYRFCTDLHGSIFHLIQMNKWRQDAFQWAVSRGLNDLLKIYKTIPDKIPLYTYRALYTTWKTHKMSTLKCEMKLIQSWYCENFKVLCAQVQRQNKIKNGKASVRWRKFT